jgi:FkbM family methyltransferase
MKKIKQLLKKTIYRLSPSVSQAGQDEWVFGEVFNGIKSGYYLDVGANDGIIHSNTFKLEQKFNWSGICIEANPLVFKELKKNRKSTCINSCLGDKPERVFFRLDGEFGKVVSIENRMESDIELKCITLENILLENKSPNVIDYMSIDIEGSEELVLKNFPFNKYTFKCITIERPTKKIRELLQANNYIIIKEIPQLDVFYIHTSFLNEYLKNMFLYWDGKTHINKLRKCLSLYN